MEYSGGVSVGARATHMQTHTRVHTPQSWLLILRIDQPIYRSYRSLFPGLKRRQTDRRTDKQTGQWSVWEDYQWTADSIIVQWTFRGFCWLHTHKHTAIFSCQFVSLWSLQHPAICTCTYTFCTQRRTYGPLRLKTHTVGCVFNITSVILFWKVSDFSIVVSIVFNINLVLIHKTWRIVMRIPHQIAILRLYLFR